jgi:hypothetical protein
MRGFAFFSGAVESAAGDGADGAGGGGQGQSEAFEGADGQEGEGLRFEGVADPAEGFHRVDLREMLAQHGHQRRVVAATAGDEPLPRGQREIDCAFLHGGGGEFGEGGGAVLRRQMLHCVKSEMVAVEGFGGRAGKKTIFQQGFD